MKAMSQTKRAANKPLNRVRDLGTATKILITGNGTSAVVGRIQKDIDSFLDDLEAFDAALWKVVHQNKERVYRFLDMLADRERKKSDGPVGELKAAWNKLLTSTETLGHDAKLGAQTLRRKADTARRRAEDAADN
jgi:hypothetical protein